MSATQTSSHKEGNGNWKSKALADAVVEEVDLCGLVGSDEKERTDMKLENACMKQEIADMMLEKVGMKFEINTLTFGLQRFSCSDDDNGFYTGFPSYSTQTSFYEFLLPSATQFNYWVSDNTENQLM